MKLKLYAYAFALGCMAMLFTACGGGGTGSATAHDSTACISCHDDPTSKTPGSGNPVVVEWKRSTHNTANAAGCADCHDDGYMHPASCTKCHSVGSLAKDPTNNPDRDGKCAKCHDKVNPRTVSDGYKSPFTDAAGDKINQNSTVTSLGTSYPVAIGVPLGVPANSTTRFVHFSTGTRANYVSANYKQNCRKCHNPHDTGFGREQRKQWAESGHGLTRGLARIGLDAKSRGTAVTLDQNYGNGNYCVRCHTSTGFINFVSSGFTYVEALPDLNGFKTNYPEYSNNAKLTATGFNGPVYTYNDKSREATNCDVCHLDTNGASSYSGKTRPVGAVTIFYPYSGKNARAVTRVDFENLGNSNLCLTCHSGRAAANTITGKDTTYRKNALGNDMVLDFTKNPGRPSSHDFAGGAVLQARKSVFFFYTSPAKYKDTPTHRTINIDGNGPCISCHMPKVASSQTGGTIHSHLFRPVAWNNDDINDSITDIISNGPVCSSCHTGSFVSHDVAYALDINVMNNLRKGFRAAVIILGRLVPGSSNWTGTNTNVTPNVAYGNSLVPVLGNLNAGAYTMGASYNQTLFLNEPSAYNHNPILVRQIMYDSIDWLKGGAAGFGSTNSPANVYKGITGAGLTGQTWGKVSPIAGAILTDLANKNYVTFADNNKEDALEFLCKGYVRNTYTNDPTNTGNHTCNRY